jgi:subtilisin family serine protease
VTEERNPKIGAFRLKGETMIRKWILLIVLAFILASCSQSTIPTELPQVDDITVQVVTASKSAKLSTSLSLLANQSITTNRSRPSGASASVFPIGENSLVTIDAFADSDPQALLRKLESLGLRNGSVYQGTVSGQLPHSSLSKLNSLKELRFARPALAITQAKTGLVVSQGVRAMGANIAQIKYGVTGKGFKVGILSDSYDFYDDFSFGDPLTTASDDIANGDLPINGVELIEESEFPGADEGRAMLQIVHDVAPGSDLAFASAFNGEASFANNIVALANAGSKVIVDDVIYLAEPMFQDGIIAQAVDSVVARGTSYFSSAGNNAAQSYETAWRDSGKKFLDAPLLDYNPGGNIDVMQRITVPAGGSILLIMQWSEPYASVSLGGKGSKSDLDMYVLDVQGKLIPSDPFFGQFTVSNDNNLNRDPIEAVQYINYGNRPETINIAITKFAGPAPTRIKWIDFGDGEVREFATNSSTTYGHANSKGAAAVGAVFYGNTPRFGVNPAILEGFSSKGGTPILLDKRGNKIFELRSKPQFVGPDGADTSFFFIFSRDPESNGFPNFFGTSASAPHVAGVAALMLEKKPMLKPSGIYATLSSTAIDMNAPGIDFETGYGLVQADRALSLLSGGR